MPRSSATTPEVRSYAVLGVVGVGTLLSAMSGSAVNLALPDMGHDLRISIELSRWVVQAFLLAVGVLLLVAGRLSDLLGHRRVYLVGFSLFGAAALGCGLAPSFGWLVVYRVLQGVGGAMVMSAAPALLTTSFPPEERGRALGMLATATYTGLTIGPPLGGLIVAGLGWRWTFHLMVPISLVVFALGLLYLPRRPGRRAALDWPGAAALLLGLPLLLLAISEGPGWGVSSWRLWAVIAAGLALLVGFVIIQLKSESPLLDLELFRSRVFTGATISALANYVSLFVVLLLLPFFLVEGLGRSSAEAGMLLAIQPLVMAVVASPSGWLSDRIGSRGLATFGMLMLAGGLLACSFLGAQSGELEVAMSLALMGFGTGIFISPNSSALMGAAPGRRQGTAGSVLAEARVLGMLVGVALGTAVFQAVGGRTGAVWRPDDFAALSAAMRVGAGIALLGAVAASLRGASGDSSGGRRSGISG